MGEWNSLCWTPSIMPRAIPERTCPSAQHRFILLRGWKSVSCQGTGSRNSHLLVHLALTCSFPGFSVQILPGEEYFCPPFPWKAGHGAQRRSTQQCTQLLSAWHFMGHTFGQTAWRQSTSVKLKWSLCRRTRNWFQLPFQLRIDRLTSVLPSNTPFPQLPHLSTAHMHRARTGTSSPLPLPKIFLSKPNQWGLMYRTAGPWLLSHWAKSAFSIAPSKLWKWQQQ